MYLLQEILRWDRELFNKINGEWTNSFFDAILPYTRNSMIWPPLYLFFIVFALLNLKRSGWYWVLLGVLTVATTDLISSWGIKELIFRLRPCRDEALAGHVRLLVGYCPQSSGFTSSHAANHFAMAMFIFLTLKNYIGKWIWLIFLWAFAISYAQVYVGVHYPLDVICGSVVGMLIGYTWAKIFNHRFLFGNAQGKQDLNPAS
jgi:undecaprenyl-diphosphatase